MAEPKHTISDLYQMQSLPLSAKIRMTKYRLREWVDEYGEDGVYVSFSGGKDSTVLLHIARGMYPDIKAAFVDTGLEYPEIRQFVKTFDNVDWLKPKMNFRQVIEKYGYPFISKEVAECVYGARKFLSGGGYEHFFRKLNATGEYASRGAVQEYWQPNSNSPKYLCEYDKLCGRGSFDKSYSGGADNKYRKLRGIGEYSGKDENVAGDSDKGQSDSDGNYP